MGTVIEFKPMPTRPAVAATPTEPKRRIVGAMFTDRFDEVTRWLIDPGVSHEDRVQFINDWREEWKMEPLEVRRDRR